MSSLVFSDAETKCHRTARYIFVPWLVRLLTDGPVRGEGEPLPIHSPQALTDETVDAIQVMVNRACWRFLARECGWKRRHSVPIGDYDSHDAKRLWDSGGALPNLRFSEATVNFLITVFNSTRKGGDLRSVGNIDMLKTNGDLLVHHLVFRRINEVPKAFGLLSNRMAQHWLQNPLNAMCDPRGYRQAKPTNTDWARLCDDDLSAFVPWIGLHQVGQWTLRENDFGADELIDRLTWLEALTLLAVDIGLQLEKSRRLGLATFFLDLMVHHENTAWQRYTEFQEFTSGLPLNQRQALASRWVDFLSFVNPLEESAGKAIAIHPIERTKDQSCYLAHWESINFSETVSRIRELSQLLRPSIF